MTQHGAWVSYGGDARIELAVGLVAAAGAAVYAGTRLRRPVRAARPGQGTVAGMFLAWAVTIVGCWSAPASTFSTTFARIT